MDLSIPTIFLALFGYNLSKMTSLVAKFLFLLSFFTLACGLVFLNESVYRKFFSSYLKFFGIDSSKLPSTAAVPDPLRPHVQQAKIGGIVFIILSLIIFAAGSFLSTL